MQLIPTQLIPNQWTELRFNGTPLELPANQLFDSSLFITGSEKQIDEIRYDNTKMGNSLPITSPLGIHVSWDGVFEFPTTDTYRFTMTTDDGMQFYIDGVLILLSDGSDPWISQAKTTYVVDVSIPAGTHQLRVEWFNKVSSFPYATFNWVVIPNTVQQLISVSPGTAQIQKVYNKQNTYVTPETIVISNISTYLISVNLVGYGGITFSPASVTIPAKQSQSIDINFNPTILNQYDYGLNRVFCTIESVAALHSGPISPPIGIYPPPTSSFPISGSQPPSPISGSPTPPNNTKYWYNGDLGGVPTPWPPPTGWYFDKTTKWWFSTLP